MFTFIESIEDLAFLNEELLLKPYVGVDTEFRRTTKDNMRLALLQINDAEEIYLVDTVLIDNPKDHCSFLFSDSVTKIFHSCKEDIEAVYSWTGEKMVNLFNKFFSSAFVSPVLISSSCSIGEKILKDKKSNSSLCHSNLLDSVKACFC